MIRRHLAGRGMFAGSGIQKRRSRWAILKLMRVKYGEGSRPFFGLKTLEFFRPWSDPGELIGKAPKDQNRDFMARIRLKRFANSVARVT